MARLGQRDGSSKIETAASYGRRVSAKRSAASLKGKGGPLGGAPPIDPKKAEAIASMSAPRPIFDVPEGEFQEEEQEFRVPKEPPSIGGVGSAYNVNQKMATGEIDRPVSMREAKNMSKEEQKVRPKKLSPETVEGLARAQEEVKVAEDKKSGEQSDVDTTADDLEKAEEEMLRRQSLFDFDSITQQRQILTNPKRKEVIEKRLQEMDISDMITKREIVQDVPVMPGKLIYTLRTFNQHEHLFCLQYIYDHPGSAVYAEEFLNTCKMVCSLVAINGALLPNHIKNAGTAQEEIDKEAFEKKLYHVANFPTHLIADISIQIMWFDERVHKLFDVGNLKNG